ncbi:MAG: DUF4175 family protein, partial [Alphaproteobacteria bacterium]|nr:DUF4175 family protein [Alphaproteobacteria bacterium]
MGISPNDETSPNLRQPSGLAVRRALARLSLFWERAWPAIWPVVGVAGTFAVLVLFGVLPRLPVWLHLLVLLLLGVAGAWFALRAVRALAWPSGDQATRRLETDSGLAHRPLTTIEDRPATGVVDPQTDRIWQMHLARAADAARDIRLRLPRPNLSSRDPLALRALLAVLVVIGVFAAGDRAGTRLANAVTPDLSALTRGSTPSLELWITPPEYTNLPPRLLASADPESARALPDPEALIAVPVGSKLLAQVSDGNRAPELMLGDQPNPLEAVSESSWRIETSLDTEGRQTVTVRQSRTTLGQWNVDVIPDTPPVIAFAAPPQGNDSNSLTLSYGAQDDHGVTHVRAEIAWPGEPPAAGIENLDLELPLPDPREGEAASVHDLTAHPWAGLEVDVQLTATDGRGQSGSTDRLSVILPERIFNHPVAREIVEQRRVLALSPDSRRDVARTLHNIGRFPQRFDNDIAVFLALMTARSRLVHSLEGASLMPVLTLLWDTALRLEDGSLSLAQRDVAQLQEQLQRALENGASEEEIRAIMEELRAALDRYLEALAQNLSQALEGMDLS